MATFHTLNQRYFANPHTTFVVQVEGTDPGLGLSAQDRIVVDRALIPQENDLVLAVIKDKFTVCRYSQNLFKDQDPEQGDFVWGKIRALIRDF